MTALQLNPPKIGLTGGIASGKSTVANFFKAFGIQVISADILARELLQKGTPTLEKVVNVFGSEILTNDMELDRKKLRELIFKDEQLRAQLNAITHPAIRTELFKQAQEARSAYVILEIPLLVESGMNDLVDRVLVVDIAQDLQIKRIMQRDQCTEAQAKQIIAAQIKPETRSHAADDLISNHAGIAKLKNQVSLLHAKYSQQYTKANIASSGLHLH